MKWLAQGCSFQGKNRVNVTPDTINLLADCGDWILTQQNKTQSLPVSVLQDLPQASLEPGHEFRGKEQGI